MALVTVPNDEKKTSYTDPDMPLFWAIRKGVGLKGTKFGYGIV